MWDTPPPLVDHRGGGVIPPPAGAVMGGQPEFHSAFPGYQPQPQQAQWPPAQGTPWAGAGGAWPAATPGPSWANTPAPAPSWANTPAQPPPWQQQHQQFQAANRPPGWAQAPMPRPGWGPAPQGAPPWAGHAGPSMPPSNGSASPRHTLRLGAMQTASAPWLRR
ncbi:hypothetical protein B0H14DRAFT_1015742 [Mycena olivaceomarginata]|nr:hypothetical protein B0H14DRAFT_1015742 [Mycena olivaceomarginata]